LWNGQTACSRRTILKTKSQIRPQLDSIWARSPRMPEKYVPFSIPTAITHLLHVHPSRRRDLLEPERFSIDPDLPSEEYHDRFGNHRGRVLAPAGRVRFRNEAVIRDSGNLILSHRMHCSSMSVTFPLTSWSFFCRAAIARWIAN
jgi:hypothetical protein